MNWDECYQKGEVIWDKGAPAPAMKQYLARQTVRGRALVPGCGRGHEVALAVEHGLDATGLDIAPTAVAEARALYPQLAERFVTGSLFDPPKEMRDTYDVVPVSFRIDVASASARRATVRRLTDRAPSFNPFNVTRSIFVQFRVAPDHREGCVRWAA